MGDAIFIHCLYTLGGRRKKHEEGASLNYKVGRLVGHQLISNLLFPSDMLVFPVFPFMSLFFIETHCHTVSATNEEKQGVYQDVV